MTDPEYMRLLRLAEEAKARGDLEACIAYQGAAIRRGDELLVASGGKALFSPINEALEQLLKT